MTDTSGPLPEPKRGLDPATRKDKGWDPRLKTLAADLSHGDKSVLVAMLQRDASEDSVAMTSRGSPNDLFWAHLSKVDLMEPRPDAAPDTLREMVIA